MSALPFFYMSSYLTAFSLFFSTMLLVMALGAQSLLVNNGKYISAIFNSFAISIGNLVLFKLAPNATIPDMIGFVSGGPVGIFLAMYLLRHLHRNTTNSPKQGDPK